MRFMKKIVVVFLAVTFFCFCGVTTASAQSDSNLFFWESPNDGPRKISAVGLVVMSYFGRDEVIEHFLSSDKGKFGIEVLRSVFKAIDVIHEQTGEAVQLSKNPLTALGYERSILAREFLASAETDEYPDIFIMLRAANAQLNGLELEPLDVADPSLRKEFAGYISWLIVALDLMDNATKEGKIRWPE